MISKESKETIVEVFTRLRDMSVEQTKKYMSNDAPLDKLESTMNKTEQYNRVLNELKGKENDEFTE